uniref:Uncharacterized protein n=1 Tax=Clytia hemisphaerica TaxID=252671 RepID=A0A7M5UWI8_9CNID
PCLKKPYPGYRETVRPPPRTIENVETPQDDAKPVPSRLTDTGETPQDDTMPGPSQENPSIVYSPVIKVKRKQRDEVIKEYSNFQLFLALVIIFSDNGAELILQYFYMENYFVGEYKWWLFGKDIVQCVFAFLVCISGFAEVYPHQCINTGKEK